MTTNFLDALKAKSDAMNETTVKQFEVVSPAPTKLAQVISDYQTRNIQALATDSANHSVTQVMQEKLLVTIDLVLDRNRIDVFFSAKPDQHILDSLRSQGFRFRPSDKAWFHKDTDSNRAFCRIVLNATGIDAGYSAGNDPDDIAESVPAPTIEEEGTAWVKYKSQVKELSEYLGISPADLLLEAMDGLHKKTFSIN